MDWYLKALKKYAVFSGRAQRMEFWMFCLFNIIIAAVLAVVESIFGSPGILSSLYSLAVFIPGIAVTVRRLHDTDRTGWWVLIGLIPMIGALVLFVFAILDSNPGENRFGPNPKGAAA